ncbi:threonine synthase [Candidatus Tremblaya phenacola PAVE]|nr:threonine synthase [Candidatus Tremblaya phenacola PAVE]
MRAYHSTRTITKGSASFRDLLTGGLAVGGGLFVPLSYCEVKRAQSLFWRFLSYQELSFRVSRHFIEDLPYSAVRGLLKAAYCSEAFSLSTRSHHTYGPVGLKVIGRESSPNFIAELSGGRSSSFKDVAMQLLGALFSYAVEGRYQVVSATSGDTGSSACYALAFRDCCSLAILSSKQNVTDLQAEQMYNTISDGLMNISLKGKFDCCQNILKGILSKHIKESFGTVNSINWARIIFQVIYYFAIYYRTTSNQKETAIISVPSGNFGNSFAGLVSKFAGLPIKTVVVSTNENNVLEEFFKTGKYGIRDVKNTIRTDCPSMDISKASNLERLVYEVLNQNGSLLSDAFGFATKGKVLNIIKYVSFRSLRAFGIRSSSSYPIERAAIIKSFFLRGGMLVDAHTANGVKSLLPFRSSTNPKIVLETAQPSKTKEMIVRTLGQNYSVGAQRQTKYLRATSCITSHISQIMRF